MRLDSIAVGYFLHIFNKKKYSFYLRGKNLIFLFITIIFIILSYYSYIGKNALAFIYISNLAAAASLLTFLYSERIFERSQFIKCLAAFGAHTSYCTYLCHLLIYQVVNGAILGDAAKLYLYLLGIVCFSVASFFVVERPFNRPVQIMTPNQIQW